MNLDKDGSSQFRVITALLSEQIYSGSQISQVDLKYL